MRITLCAPADHVLKPCLLRTDHARVHTCAWGSAESALSKHAVSTGSVRAPHSLQSHDPSYINRGAFSQRHFQPKLLQDKHHIFEGASFTKNQVNNHAQEGQQGEEAAAAAAAAARVFSRIGASAPFYIPLPTHLFCSFTLL